MSTEPLVCDETIIKVTLGGKEFDLFAFDVLETISAVERAHRDTANECRECGTVQGASDGGAKCGACGSDALGPSRAYSAALVAALRDSHGLPAMSNLTALRIRMHVLEIVDAKKNESMTTPERLSSSPEPASN